MLVRAFFRLPILTPVARVRRRTPLRLVLRQQLAVRLLPPKPLIPVYGSAISPNLQQIHLTWRFVRIENSQITKTIRMCSPWFERLPGREGWLLPVFYW